MFGISYCMLWWCKANWFNWCVGCVACEAVEQCEKPHVPNLRGRRGRDPGRRAVCRLSWVWVSSVPPLLLGLGIRFVSCVCFYRLFIKCCLFRSSVLLGQYLRLVCFICYWWMWFCCSEQGCHRSYPEGGCGIWLQDRWGCVESLNEVVCYRCQQSDSEREQPRDAGWRCWVWGERGVRSWYRDQYWWWKGIR